MGGNADYFIKYPNWSIIQVSSLTEFLLIASLPPQTATSDTSHGLRATTVCLLENHLVTPVIALLLCLILLLGFAVAGLVFPPFSQWLLIGQVISGVIALAILAYLVRYLQSHILASLRDMRNWATQMRSGDLSARVNVERKGECARLAHDINILSEEFQFLSLDMEAKVRQQTHRLGQQTEELQLLYDVAMAVNNSTDINQLLTAYLFTLMKVTGATAGNVRVMTDDGRLHQVASVGLDDDLRDDDFGSNMISIPLEYMEETIGIYNLYDYPGDSASNDHQQGLLTSLGHHLGIAIKKASLERETARLSIVDERTQISHELHDSLAQTLASMRFQAQMLDDALDQNDTASQRRHTRNLKSTLDEAYTEVRELIAHFRAPIDKRGLLPSLEGLMDKFRQQTGIISFLQNACEQVDLPPNVEMQILRIVQEALANIRKHSQAQTVRVLLRCTANGGFRVLIEDDGIGFEEQILDSDTGEHIGLSIMQQRARRADASFSVESEPGEGTRIIVEITGPSLQQTEFKL